MSRLHVLACHRKFLILTKFDKFSVNLWVSWLDSSAHCTLAFQRNAHTTWTRYPQSINQSTAHLALFFARLVNQAIDQRLIHVTKNSHSNSWSCFVSLNPHQRNNFDTSFFYWSIPHTRQKSPISRNDDEEGLCKNGPGWNCTRQKNKTIASKSELGEKPLVLPGLVALLKLLPHLQACFPSQCLIPERVAVHHVLLKGNLNGIPKRHKKEMEQITIHTQIWSKINT